MTPRYRPDIDGLRAIAVLSVVFFHFHVPFFPGGYVGVDIFFVISGFLITTILIRELKAETFSLARFYERRVRRIIPALSLVILVSLGIGYFLLGPDHFILLAQSAVASAFFSSNFLFFAETGYFDPSAYLKPLLHTWSLAVEEQFYILYPLLLMIIFRFGRKKYFFWLLFLGSMSLLWCGLTTSMNRMFAFYLLPTRAWEFALGGLLALPKFPVIKKKTINEVIGFLGLVLIVVSVVAFKDEEAFPGFRVLIPTVGAFCVIQAGRKGPFWVGRFLSLRPLVFTGLISYSLYLWHWPALVYSKIYFIKPMDPLTLFGLFIGVFVLSILSWRFVETPFRKGFFLASRPSLFVGGGAVSALILFLGLNIVVNEGFGNRLDKETQKVLQTYNKREVNWGLCAERYKAGQDPEKFCDMGSPEGPYQFVLMGDSHAFALAEGLSVSARESGIKGKLVSRLGCPPLLSIERRHRRSCDQFVGTQIDQVIAENSVRTVFLSARWPINAIGARYKVEPGNSVELVDLEQPDNDSLDNKALMALGLKRTVEKLIQNGKKVVLVGSVPEVGYDVPAGFILARRTGRNLNDLIAPTRKEYEKRNAAVKEIFLAIEKEYDIGIIELDRLLCDDRRCHVEIDGKPLYWDDDHLSAVGSRLTKPLFDEYFKDNGIQPEN